MNFLGRVVDVSQGTVQQGYVVFVALMSPELIYGKARVVSEPADPYQVLVSQGPTQDSVLVSVPGDWDLLSQKIDDEETLAVARSLALSGPRVMHLG
jgi:hypothetical protein